MARDDPVAQASTTAQARHVISLIGPVDKLMVEKLCAELAKARPDQEVEIELTTDGGDAELGRRMALEIRTAARNRARPVSFLGKTEVHSAGVTIMGAFPKERRRLSGDTVLLIHGRQLDKTVEITDGLRSSAPKLEAVRREIEIGLKLEEREFRELIKGSKIELSELLEKIVSNWYLTAEEALELGLVEAVVE